MSLTSRRRPAQRAIEKPTLRVLTALLMLGCTSGERSRARGSDSAGAAEANPAAGAQWQGLPLSVLLDSLRTTRATFTRTNSGRWEFNGDQRLLEAIATHGDSAVAQLVGCLDIVAPSRVSLEGRPVPIGVVCYQALRHFAYYEWDCGSDTSPLLCAGFVEPTASPAVLRRAKEAWQEALARKIVVATH